MIGIMLKKNEGESKHKEWKRIVCMAWLLVPFSSQGADMNIDGSLHVQSNATFQGKVGIGTTNPVQTLDIHGPIRGNRQAGTLRIQTDTGYLDLGPRNHSFSHFYTDKDKYYFNREIRVDSGNIGSHNQDLNLKTEGTTRMTISRANGNVGIGTVNPQAKLHVNGAVKGAQQSGTLRVQTDTGYLDLGPRNHSFSHFYTDKDKYYFNREIRVDSGNIGSHNQDLNLKTEGTTRMTISRASGNVGIGTTTPDAKLDVEGDARFTGAILINPSGNLTMDTFTHGPRP